MRRTLFLLTILGILLTGCTATEPSVYKADGTVKCLRDSGYQVTTDSAQVGVVAAAAPNGGLLAREPGNAVTIAFAADADDAQSIGKAFTRFAPKKLRPHISDVMRTEKNAVLLWTITPPIEELTKVVGCLKG
jgi:hypothetical protein